MVDLRRGGGCNFVGVFFLTNNFSMFNNTQLNPADERARIDALLASAPDAPAPEKLINLKNSNQWLAEQRDKPNPRALWLDKDSPIWNEGEVACLFADSNLGKSVLAVQIADTISEQQPVVYFDFELSAKQFQLRYSDPSIVSTGTSVHRFSDNFKRAELNIGGFTGGDFETEVMDAIEAATIEAGARVLIIDNLTWLCAQSESADCASILMQRLVGLKKKHGWSILVIAHTPKRKLNEPLTQNDLAGSKRLFNFFDSVFAIGASSRGNTFRYLKQIKVRSGVFKYTADNVLLLELVKQYTFLNFVEAGTATEASQLPMADDIRRREQLRTRALALQAQGLSQRKIAEELGVSIGMANKLLH